MKYYTLTSTLLFSLIISPLTFAKSDLELTPQIGYRFGGEFDLEESGQSIDMKDTNSFGLMLAWDYDRKRQGELLLSHYESEIEDSDNALALGNNDLSITYLHIGGNVPISDGTVPLWVSGGIGLTHFAPDDDDLDSETEFSANLGLNTRVNITENTALKVGGRIYATFLDSDSAIFCNNADCTIYVSSEVWVQTEIYAGLTLKF